MVVHLLPETMFGMDTDDVLCYTTPKVAVIRDRYVGALYYLLMLLALGWVLVGQVFWRNEHFQLKDVRGIPRMWLSQPTINQCDPNEPDCLSDYKSLSELPYCRQHTGGPEVAHAADCIYADKHTMFVDGTVGSQVFIPTSVVVINEVKQCDPSDKNGYTCKNEYQKQWGDKGYYFNETIMEFYANIEDYVVQFTSTYHREDISGTSLDHPGFYMECMDEDKDKGKRLSWKQRLNQRHKVCEKERRRPIECMPGLSCNKGGLKTIEDVDIKKTVEKDDSFLEMDALGPASSFLSTSGNSLRALRAQQMSSLARKPNEEQKSFSVGGKKYRPTPDVYSSTWGDTFKLGKLMELAGVDLDRHFNMDDYTSRMAGTIIEVEATYNNLRRFLSSLGLSQVRYTYRVKERKLPYVSKESMHPNQPEDFPKRRRYLVQHGILLNFQVGGEFGFFNIVYLLIMLTTSLALLATAHKVSDLISLYVHPRQCNYFHMKYDVSGDFSDMWECKVCGYLNHNCDDKCQGLDKWESFIDGTHCLEPRPPPTPKPAAKAATKE